MCCYCGSSGIGAALIKELKSRKAKTIINIDIKQGNEKNTDFFNVMLVMILK